MTQFEVMINIAGIKTKEGEDFVKVVKEIRVPGDPGGGVSVISFLRMGAFAL